MWVMRVSDFIETTLPLPKHEELLEKGMLHQQTPSRYCIFVSHQWLSSAHPDPEGKQLAVLQNCLRGICDGSVEVMNDAASQLYGEFRKLSAEQQVRIKDAYLWLDWISIPQIVEDADDSSDEVTSREISARFRRRSRGLRISLRSFRYRSPGGHTHKLTEQEEYILSIPSFVQACQVFIALVPPVPHHDTQQVCNYSSWFTRGWCRTELWCKMMLGNQDMPIMVISANDKADFGRPVNWVDWLPHEGEFSLSRDRALVVSIFEQALSHRLLWLQMGEQWDLYRYFLARSQTLTGQALVRRSCSDFLDEFGFKSIELAKKQSSTMGPLLCASLAGDVELVKSLLEAKCQVDGQPLEPMEEVGIVGGLTPLHVVVMHGWRCPGVLETLLQAQADANLVARGIPVLAYCRTATDVEILVKYRADVNLAAPPLKVPVLALASGENTKPEVIAKLLECRASPNGPTSGGIGTTHPVSLLSINARSNPYAIDVANLLMKGGSNINQQCKASGVFYGLEILNRTYLHFAKPRSNLMIFSAEWSTTPLGFACLFGSGQLVKLLLEQKGDLQVKNSRGHTPKQLAKSREVIEVIETFEAEMDALTWEVPSAAPLLELKEWNVPAPSKARETEANKSPAFLPPSPTFARQVETEDFYDEWPVDVEKPRVPMMPSIRKR